MESTRPANLKIKSLRSPWTDQGAYETVGAWLRLSTSRAESIALVGCQYDGIAMGARKAFKELPDSNERERWLSLPFTGIDGLPTEGQAWVDEGLLTATVISGTTTRVAIEMVVKALRSGTQPPERTLALPAIVKGVFYDDDCMLGAWDLVKAWSWSERLDAYEASHKEALDARVRGGRLLDLARELTAIARVGLTRQDRKNANGENETIYLEELESLLAAGKSPAKVLVEKWQGPWRESIHELVEYSAYRIR